MTPHQWQVKTKFEVNKGTYEQRTVVRWYCPRCGWHTSLYSGYHPDIVDSDLDDGLRLDGIGVVAAGKDCDVAAVRFIMES